MNILGKRIKERREAKGWTQEQLASEIKVSRSAIGDYETGRKSPRYDRLDLIANVLGTSTDYLLGRTEEKEPLDQIKYDVQSSTPDLNKILKETSPNYSGKPLSSEQKDTIMDFIETILKRDKKEQTK